MLDILQKVFYRSNPAREAFVEMCEDSYVQKMTFDSYLYKTVVPGALLLTLLSGVVESCNPWQFGDSSAFVFMCMCSAHGSKDTS